MEITGTQIRLLREKAGNRLLDLLVELEERDAPVDIVIDKLIRSLSNLAENPGAAPYVRLFPEGLTLREYRIRAGNRVEELLNALVVTDFHEVDYILDKLIRELTGLPVRPEERQPLVGLFPLPTYSFSCKSGLSHAQCSNAQLILDEATRQGVTNKAQLAYLLATAEHESHLKPIREGYSDAAGRRQARKRGYSGGELYYGRGFVQLTHLENYMKYAKILNLPLVGEPDLVLQPKVAAFILVHGSKHGIFTGRKLDDYISRGRVDFIGARRIINGRDKAEHIGKLARDWLNLL